MKVRCSRDRLGFSVVELMIAVTLLVGVLGGLALAAGQGLIAFYDSGVRLEVRSRAQRALARASQELLGVSAATLNPDLRNLGVGPPLWTSSLEFARATDWSPAGALLSSNFGLVLELDAGETNDGTDDDGDGLIDEQRLVLVVDAGLVTEERVVLATSLAELLEGEFPNGVDDNGNGLVDEGGFCASREGELLILDVTAMKAIPGAAPVVHTERIAVGIRNR